MAVYYFIFCNFTQKLLTIYIYIYIMSTEVHFCEFNLSIGGNKNERNYGKIK